MGTIYTCHEEDEPFIHNAISRDKSVHEPIVLAQRIRFSLSGYSSSARSPPSVVAIAHPSRHIDIQLLRSHLIERGLRGMSVRA